MGGIFGMAESLVAATDHQGNDTPHIHGLMAVVSPQQYKTLEEIRDEMQQDMEDFERMKRFREHLLREDHYDDKAHQSQLEQLERAKEEGLEGLPHLRLATKPNFLKPNAT